MIARLKSPAILERATLVALAAFTVLSTAGYGYFGLHPENLPASEGALRFYSVSFQFFAQVHIVLAFLTLAVMLSLRTGYRWVPALGVVYLVSFTSEHIGTGFGIPFGGYEYTGLLGARLGPRVPLLIPLSWFLMALPSWVIGRAAFPRQRTAAITLGALGLVLWDLALDPAMSFLTPYWRWEDAGPYYGMPWLNLLGWFATGVVLMIALEWANRDGRLDGVPVRWSAAYYGLVALLPIGMLAVAGAWLAVGTTLVAMTVVGVFTQWLRPATEPGDRRFPSPARTESVPGVLG